jgi:energy-coupling factor transporter ATP-binding protein EcfA2
MSRINQLTIENYRGASSKITLDFDNVKPVTLIFGENGTGKTTIVDALDVIGNCSKGSIEAKSSTKARDHLPTIGKKAADVKIHGVSGLRQWTASLSGDTLSTIPDIRPKVRVLRRSHLQKLIEAQPAQRYEALRHFIDVNNVERSENTLRDAYTAIKAEFELAVRKRLDAESQLKSVWEAEGKPNSDYLAWAKNIAIKDIKKLEDDLQSLRLIYSHINRSESALSEFEEAEIALSGKQSEDKLVDQEIADQPGLSASQTINLVGILRQVDQHLNQDQLSNECPVCLQSISTSRLKTNIENRLSALQNYEALQSRKQTSTQNLLIAAQILETKKQVLTDSAKKLIEIIDQNDIEVLEEYNFDSTKYPELSKQDIDDVLLAISEARNLIQKFASLKKSIFDAGTDISKKTGQVNSIKVQYNQVVESERSTESLEKLQQSLSRAYDAARLTRIKFTQKILDGITTECNRLYAQIHPGEPIAISKLELDTGKRASLNQAASFEGHNNVPPQAYFSESHLDTLGFCFWLALVKRENPNKDAIIVLDDVFTSVDSQHISRISQLIIDESENFAHVIITTHQRLWRDIFRNPHGAGKLTELIELQRWSLAKGISNYKTKLAVKEIADSILAMPFDRQSVASKSGILLESIFDFIALQYRCRVPRTIDNSYTLSELLDGTYTLFKTLETQTPLFEENAGNVVNPIQYVASKVSDLINELRQSAFVRNQVGAHYNISGTSISDNDVEEFAKLSVKLAIALSCSTCGQIPSKKTQTHYQCSCKTNEMRMTPLQA